MKYKILLKTLISEAYLTVPFNIKRYGIGDFYVQMDGINAGKPFKERPDTGGNYYAVTTDPNILLPDYFFIFINYLYMTDKFKVRLQGTTVPHLNIKIFTTVVIENLYKSTTE